MSNMEQIDDNTRKVVAEALRVSREINIEASATVLAFITRAIALEDPDTFSLEGSISSSVLAEFVQAVVERVRSGLTLAGLESIKMEVEVERMYIAQGKSLQDEARAKEEDLMSKSFQVTSSRYKPDSDDSEFFTQLYRKIFTYVASVSGMESALTDPEAESESLAALDSVFPQHGLRRFLSLSREDKTAQLNELQAIVLGIRIFNRSLGKGGVGLGDPVGPLEGQARRLEKSLRNMVASAQMELDQYELVIEYKATTLRPTEGTLPGLRAEHSNRLVFLDLAHFLLEQVEKGFETIELLANQYADDQKGVQELVGSRQSVPKEKVYPKLHALGTAHALMLEEQRTLLVLARVTEVLELFATSFDPVLTMKDVQEAQQNALDGEVLLGEAGPPPHPDPIKAAYNNKAQMCTWNEACEGRELPSLRCGGFSVVTAVKREGLLLRASPDATVVRWEGGLYGFLNEEEAEMFSANPAEYLAALIHVVASVPELVRLLRLEDMVPSLRMSHVVELMSMPVTCDFGTQTPTHFIEKNMDRSYEWNEWAARRRVLALTNLRQKRTHSQQTQLSHYRRDQKTQVWLPKTSFTQTVVQKGTTMPQKKMYIEGLRGAPDVRMNIINVDLDLGQPHEL
mmetsp:Transcript_41250/g.69035  ORF Transcript_41250/g.69035 Transcript_41250/m.69035 type:complete len:628 (+) Transcript_41250:212-2095(+)